MTDESIVLGQRIPLTSLLALFRILSVGINQ